MTKEPTYEETMADVAILVTARQLDEALRLLRRLQKKKPHNRKVASFIEKIERATAIERASADERGGIAVEQEDAAEETYDITKDVIGMVCGAYGVKYADLNKFNPESAYWNVLVMGVMAADRKGTENLFKRIEERLNIELPEDLKRRVRKGRVTPQELEDEVSFLQDHVR